MCILLILLDSKSFGLRLRSTRNKDCCIHFSCCNAAFPSVQLPERGTRSVFGMRNVACRSAVTTRRHIITVSAAPPAGVDIVVEGQHSTASTLQWRITSVWLLTCSFLQHSYCLHKPALRQQAPCCASAAGCCMLDPCTGASMLHGSSPLNGRQPMRPKCWAA